MKAPISWLREYVDIDVDIETLCRKMVDIGFEIEEVDYLGSKINNIVVGQITEISQHPNADRLRCCKVNIGSEIIPIVTNDQHVAVGDKVPVALHDAHTANGLHIKKGKMRGEESHGMFCGGEELGVTADMYPNADMDGVLVLQSTATVGEDIRREVGLDDYVLDFNITSNRQDCNSIYGLAREVAVALGKKCRPLDVSYTVSSDTNTSQLVDVDVQNTELCNGYLMQGVTDVAIAKSPLWMTSRLAKVGLHGINNLVDITNYVLWEVGQPMHAFDYRDITDKKIVVRSANKGEKITVLDGKEYQLDTTDLVIADNNRAVGLAGVMGGLNSGIKDSTTTVLFESARFSRENIRRTSRRLGLRSDSSARFEKGVDSYSPEVGLDRALNLICQLQCGKVTLGRISKTVENNWNNNITFEKSRVKQLLGISVEDEKVKSILESLGIKCEIKGETISCIAPRWREYDLRLDCDIIEEIIRVHGYDNIFGTLMNDTAITIGGKPQHVKAIDKAKGILVGMRYNECIFYPFAGSALYNKSVKNYDTSKNIALINPIAEDLAFMNRELYHNMLQCISLNHSRKNYKLRLFESGKVYLTDELPLQRLPIEENRICMASTYAENIDQFKQEVLQLLYSYVDDVKFVEGTSPWLHPGVSADVMCGDECVAVFGKVHPEVAKNFDFATDVYAAEIRIDALNAHADKTFRYQTFAKFPSIDRDFALVMKEEVHAQDIVDCFTKIPLCENVKVFDVYRNAAQLGEGNKSIAVTVTFRDKNKTLEDKNIEKQLSSCLKELQEKYGATLR